MGAWGGGLYDSDFACDLRADFKGFFRAPLSDDEFLAKIGEAHGPPDGDDHVDACDYWLVLADQLERQGLHRQDVFERAVAIIENGEDLAALEKLGAEAGTIARRRKVTAELLDRLRNPRPAKPRRPLRKPQPLLFEVGDALIWPTDRGQEMSPWVPGGFKQDGWGFAIVTDTLHEYGVFAKYAVQMLMWRRPERPTLEVAAHCRRSHHAYGTISKRHVENMGIERIGKAPPDALGPPPNPQFADHRGIEWHLDAFNKLCWNFLKFPIPAPSGTPIDPDEPDQRPGFEEFLAEFDARTARNAG